MLDLLGFLVAFFTGLWSILWCVSPLGYLRRPETDLVGGFTRAVCNLKVFRG